MSEGPSSYSFWSSFIISYSNISAGDPLYYLASLLNLRVYLDGMDRLSFAVETLVFPSSSETWPSLSAEADSFRVPLHFRAFSASVPFKSRMSSSVKCIKPWIAFMVLVGW